MKNFLLNGLLRPVLKKNNTFKNSFFDQTCYIFGNGASLKYIDFNYFTDYPTIGINHLILHKDFKLLNTCCYTLPEPMSFYNYFKNPYKLEYEKNIMGNLFRSQIVRFPKIPLFTSFTNIFGSPNKNTYYLHHFGKRKPDLNYLDICSEFSYLAGGLYAGIGLAISFGFKRAILVGENSYGKGSVQSVIPLQNRGAIRLTISKYYLPSGKSISEVGVTPDIEVTEGSDDFKINSENDNQLEFALKLFNG